MVNLVQDGHTRDMLFSIDAIIADVSQYFSLNIGDLIFTGTPSRCRRMCYQRQA
jgi:2-keto-4-pentenoate hydratase/2-oxohepta-3-ene-1,7-dioic acid hydratase in catechol pathway